MQWLTADYADFTDWKEICLSYIRVIRVIRGLRAFDFRQCINELRNRFQDPPIDLLLRFARGC